MRQQSIGIVLCALLLSSYGHDILTRSKLAHQAKQSHLHSLARAETTSRQCEISCSGSVTTNNLDIAFNASANLVGIFNLTSQRGLIIDLKANLSGIISLEQNSILIINLQTNETRRVDNVWTVEGEVSLEIVFRSLTSLQVLYERGTKVEVSAELQWLIRVLVDLNNGEYDISENNALQVYLAAVLRLSASLRVVIRFIRSESIQINIQFSRFIEVIYGFRVIVQQIGVERLVRANLSLELRAVLQASGAALLQLVLNGISQSDVQAALGSLSARGVLEFLVRIYGESEVGVGGVYYVLLSFIRLRAGEIDSREFISIVFKFAANGNADLEASWNAQLQVLLKVAQAFSLSNLRQFVEGIIKGVIAIETWKLATAIRLIIAIGRGINVVANIIEFLIEAGLRAGVAVAALFRGVIAELASRAGALRISVIFQVQFDAAILAASNPLTVIFRGATNLTLRILLNVRALVQIVSRINQAALRFGANVFTSLLTNWSIFSDIQALIKVNVGISVSANGEGSSSGSGSGGSEIGGSGTGEGEAGGSGTGEGEAGGSGTGEGETGGSGTGEGETGGSVSGGSEAGGSATGGVETGGSATGGSETGGSATGGIETGGSATGGIETGGSAGGSIGGSAGGSIGGSATGSSGGSSGSDAGASAGAETGSDVGGSTSIGGSAGSETSGSGSASGSIGGSLGGSSSGSGSGGSSSSGGLSVSGGGSSGSSGSFSFGGQNRNKKKYGAKHSNTHNKKEHEKVKA